MTINDVLKSCQVVNNTVKLPDVTLDRKMYLEVKNSLVKIGGKWIGGKIQGFVFDYDPTELLKQVSEGVDRNLKKEFQLFETPEELAIELIEYAFIKARVGGKVLEPSAGKGAIIKAIHQYQDPYINVRYCEINALNQPFLSNVLPSEKVGDDFLELKQFGEYATIIANPPFTKNQDIDHVYHMYKHLKPGGRLVSVTSAHWRYANNAKEQEFRKWLESLSAEIVEVPRGRFKASGTNVETAIVIINKAL